ncbi:pyridoxal phosphate-dependent aminotransferase [Mesosutterella sp. OilRF-GAM-744-9]|uniref:cysteine-S-conjugate beta-lyase n=1 Tax=Mesosutterella porci TaxID=2915351 RepID=A0ABS9MNG1_9BURK|nr:MalY/PatB family protein [Mesosutterella sp. oilRF-744-WT-GAM-9]MCG5029869.1 pyridoxal phosphate-dependent aminotransferase [Mesosutterella sp. oilRF-744-WT-GAM-9]
MSPDIFDEPVERRGTRSLKWDSDAAEGVIELWVADMDFRTAPVVRRAIERRAAEGVFGYGIPTEDFYRAVCTWQEKRHGLRCSPESIIPVTGVVPGISAVLQALLQPGEQVIIQTPAYNCFFSSIRNSGLELSANALRLEGGRWKIDFEDLERRAAEPRAKALLLCSPHNPTGRVWSRGELEAAAALCERRGLYLISDEIHEEFVPRSLRFTPAAAVSDWAAEHCITLSAASKAFNIAGLQAGYVIVPDPEDRRRVDRRININEICDANPLGVDALIAAYSSEGQEWLDALNAYIARNREVLRSFVSEKLPECILPEMEGTYLAWLDMSAFGLPSDEIERELLEKHRVRIAAGSHYGETSAGWIRINLATQTRRLRVGLERIAAWAAEHRGS